MIYLLHGEDKTAAYARLEQIIKTHPQAKRLNFSKENTRDDLYMAIFGTSLLEDQNALIVQNFLKDKKLTVKDEIFKNTPKDTLLVFWEEGQISPSQIKSLAPLAQIEAFKPQLPIFRFLDTLSPNAKRTLSSLQKVEAEGESSTQPIIWHLSSRLVLLILAKLGASLPVAAKITGRNLAPWQWDKIRSQAALFDLETLKHFLAGCLKADLANKTGKTNLAEPTLTTFLILKYLKS